MFESLRVINFKKHTRPVARLATPLKDAFFINTCLRNLWVYTTDRHTGMPLDLNGHDSQHFDLYQGDKAYAFLLAVASGLESEILGETEILGQIKNAWNQSDLMSSKSRSALAPVMQKLFEDTKNIRSTFMHSLGGNSYGSLVRKLIRERTSSGMHSPILLVGAGKLAEQVAPWLIDDKICDPELMLWNRTPEKVFALARIVYKKRTDNKIKIRVLDPTEELLAWKTAAHVISCIPYDFNRDVARRLAFASGNEAADSARSVIHLGGFRNKAAGWNEMKNFYCLDELFKLQKKQDFLRERMLVKARTACLERARLRFMGQGLTYG